MSDESPSDSSNPIASPADTDQAPTTEKSSTPTSPANVPLSKIEVIFKAVGDAPILKQSKWNVPLSKTVGWVNGNIRKYLKLETSETLFLYVRQSFAPSLDQTIENLYNCFGSGDGKLILHYSRTQAWG